VERRCSGTATSARTLFPVFVVYVPTAFILCVNAWQAFFSFFQGAPRGLDECLPVEEGKGVRMRIMTAVFTSSVTLNEDSKT